MSLVKLSPKVRGVVAAAAAATLLTTGAVIATPEANAFPSGCSAYPNSTNGGIAICYTGTGSFQVVVGCKNLFGYWTEVTGPWIKVGNGASTAGCPWGYSQQWVGFYAKD